MVLLWMCGWCVKLIAPILSSMHVLAFDVDLVKSGNLQTRGQHNLTNNIKGLINRNLLTKAEMAMLFRKCNLHSADSMYDAQQQYADNAI